MKKKFSADPTYWKTEKEKYEARLEELKRKEEKDESEIEWLRKRISECDEQLGNSQKSNKEVDGKKIAAIGVIGAAVVPVLFKLVYTQLRYSRAKSLDQTQMEEDRYDSDNKRSSF